MKKLILSLLVVLTHFAGRADEGMWLSLLISQNYEAMQGLGLELTPERIYSINESARKGAIVRRGGRTE